MPARTNVAARTGAGVGKPEEKEPAGNCAVMAAQPFYGDCGLGPGCADAGDAASNTFVTAGLSEPSLPVVERRCAAEGELQRGIAFGNGLPVPANCQDSRLTLRRARPGRVMSCRS